MEPTKTDDVLSSARHQVLEALKRRGEATAGELAEALGVSASAVRQHLSALRSAGYVEARQERGQPGRPADRFHTTDRAEALFASRSQDLSVELLAHMDAEDPELVSRIFDRRRRHRVEQARSQIVGDSTEEKVARLAELLDSEGYLADVTCSAEGTCRINLHSCAIWEVANKYPQACAAELELLRELIPEARIDRVTHKSSGAHLCAYEVSL